jgi:hypothetical protein
MPEQQQVVHNPGFEDNAASSWQVSGDVDFVSNNQKGNNFTTH